MRDGPNIARVAGVIGEPARAEMLSVLMGGQALTATELAAAANVTKQTASAHLSKLLEARLVAMESQGRHRYFRLADDDVAHLLESLMGVAFRSGAVRVRTSPREPALRSARVCYDHLAGDQGVQLLDSLLKRKLLRRRDDALELTPAGADFFRSFGIDIDALSAQRRPLCRTCLDWSVRRHHLGGAVGAGVLARMFALGWARRAKGSRVVTFTPAGAAALSRKFFA
ncbi:MAG TPA: helix-turn-helix transcriptional regulator [Burkholderiaceae bacterium]|nr:helix-turn-helix transcriptional regulator [Burkholderiaceae bacterium]